MIVRDTTALKVLGCGMKLTGRQYLSALMVLIVLAFVPVLSVDQPFLADYPNHLARVHVWLSHISNDPVPNVEPVWALQPNMAFELVTGFLTLFMPLKHAGHGFILLTIVSLAVGPAILGRALWKTFSFWSLLPFLFIYNRLFFWGFLGYLFSLGVAFALSSLWVASARAERKALWFVIATLSALLVLGLHLYAFAIFGLINLFLTLRSADHLSVFSKGWFYEVFYKLAPLVVALSVFALGAPVFESERNIKWGPFSAKLNAFGGLLIGPNIQADLILGGLVAIVLAVILAVNGKRLKPVMDKWLLGGLVFLILIHFSMPAQLLSSYGADQRLPIAIALLSIASLPPLDFRRQNLVDFLAICLLAIFVFRLIYTRSDWIAHQKIHTELTQAYQQLPRKASVLSLIGTTSTHGLPRTPLTEHLGFAVIEKSVFWPGLFAYPIHGAQTIRFLNPCTIPSGIADLQKIPLSMLNDVVAGAKKHQNHDLIRTSSHYQYVVVIREDGLASTLPENSVFGTLHNKGDYFAIYETPFGPKNHRGQSADSKMECDALELQ
ncbi:hypothetical protein [Diaphorobacter sp.]|uniref:hypothetical protein n=1 Tax=Diaphorobacter sp. TaxID=1934310 RepID=UPI003D095A92